MSNTNGKLNGAAAPSVNGKAYPIVDHDYDVVVVGAGGAGTLKRLVFGSVSTGVLHHAPCPVLVARA